MDGSGRTDEGAARAQRQRWEIGDGQGVRSLAEHVEALARAGIDPPPEIIWPAEFLNMPEPERDWLLDGVLPLGGLNLLTASPKVGKSTFARCLAVAVAQGRQFLGRKVARGTVLIVSLEDSDRSTYRHFRDIGLADDDPVGMIRLAALPDQYHARLHFLEGRIAANKATLVILDTVSKFLRIADSNAYAAVSNALDPLLQVARRTGACILATHHCRKSGGQDGAETLGSTAFFGACDTLVSLTRAGAARSLYSIQREGVDLPPTHLAIDARGWISSSGPVADANNETVDDQILRAIGAQPTKTGDVLQRTRFGRKTVLDSLRRLTEAGVVK